MMFTGTGVAIITPFDQNHNVDKAALKRIVNHLIKGRVEYIVAMGTTGESATLSEKEQEVCIDLISETIGGRIPMVIGVGGNDTRKVAKRASYISKMYKPKGLLSVCPYYNKPSQKGLYHHFQAIAQSTDTPIILYNVPGRTSSNILPDTAVQLAQDFPNIVAIKEASGNIEQGMDIIAKKPKDFQVLSGEDALTLSMIAVGYEGVISVTANALPFYFSEMVRLALKGRIEEARMLHYQIWGCMKLNFKEGNPSGIKTMMEALALCERTTRLPVFPGSNSLMEEIKKELASIRSNSSYSVNMS